MRIVVDAMGSDQNPGPDVAGAVQAAREWGDEIILVGDRARVEAELAGHDTAGLRLTVHHAAEAITMHDKPRDVVRGKPDSSMHAGMTLVKEGAADAFVTAGNTGGALAVAMLATLRRIPGIKRPALGVVFPIPSRPMLIDNGANADCTADQLVQFAQMGALYAACVHGIDRPRVALISNGEEEGKGNDLIKEAAALLETTDLNFIGNVEPKEFMDGATDVGVTDGFVGNIMIKTAEATARVLVQAIRQEIKAGLLTALGGALARPALKRVALSLDPNEVGGAPLLGVNGVVIVAHGRSNARAIQRAIWQARRAVEFDIIRAIHEGIARNEAANP